MLFIINVLIVTRIYLTQPTTDMAGSRVEDACKA
jgi:hypothetical protein